jgi:hypothetical protein
MSKRKWQWWHIDVDQAMRDMPRNTPRGVWRVRWRNFRICLQLQEAERRRSA